MSGKFGCNLQEDSILLAKADHKSSLPKKRDIQK